MAWGFYKAESLEKADTIFIDAHLKRLFVDCHSDARVHSKDLGAWQRKRLAISPSHTLDQL